MIANSTLTFHALYGQASGDECFTDGGANLEVWDGTAEGQGTILTIFRDATDDRGAGAVELTKTDAKKLVAYLQAVIDTWEE